MLRELATMLISLGVILISAEGFTNGVEWLGKRLNLGAGAVGSILAAVGTALPETMVPIIAFLSAGAEEGIHDVGIGAILGAPFMLATLAFCISGLAVLIFRRNNGPLLIDPGIIRRDIGFFLVVYTLAILASFLPAQSPKIFLVIVLPAIYFYYVLKTLRSSDDVGGNGDLPPLYIARRSPNPALNIILAQIALSLLGIVIGAHGFVDAVQSVALATGIPAFVLSLIITPIATELPEKFNSVIWLRRGKDTLALGNITGAMVFQSSVIPAIGIALTPWQLDPLALWSAFLALGSGFIPYLALRRRGVLFPVNLMVGGGFYLLFILTVLRSPQFH